MSDFETVAKLNALEKEWHFWGADKVVCKSGGLVDPGYLDEFHRMACGLVRHLYLNAVSSIQLEAYADQITNLSLFFIESDERNALALERTNAKGIGIHLGLVRATWALLYLGIGTGRLVEVWFDSPPPLKSNVAYDDVFADPIWNDGAAERWGQDRIGVHNELVRRVFDFVIYHELAHHTRGHISYLQAEFGMSELEESLNFSAEPGAKRDALRNLEFDADHAAMDMIIAAWDRRAPLTGWSAAKASKEFFIQSLAIIVLFQILDEAHSPMASHYAVSHPAPVHRAMRLTAALARTFARQFGWSDEAREEEHDLAWLAASDLASLLQMPEGRWRGSDTEDMDHARFAKEDAAFVEFARKLDAMNAEEKP